MRKCTFIMSAPPPKVWRRHGNVAAGGEGCRGGLGKMGGLVELGRDGGWAWVRIASTEPDTKQWNQTQLGEIVFWVKNGSQKHC